MDEEKYAVAFQLIMNAGNAKSYFMMAIEAARAFQFDEARNNYEQGLEEMRLAHQCQTEMIQKEAQGNSVEVNIILVHAQDHLTMAFNARDYAEELIHVYELLSRISDRLDLNLKEEQ